MAEEPNAPGQNEGRGEKPTKRAQPVNLAMVEAAERGIDLNVPAKAPANASAKAAEPEPVPEPPAAASPAAEPADPATAMAELAELAEAATKGRLSPADEDRATSHMRVCIANGEDGLGAAMAAMGKLPWILGVRAVEQSWLSLSEEVRAALLARLAEERFGDFIRLRLSVARSLAKIDPPVGVQLAASVCRAIWIADKGMLTPADSKLVGNVFIGRGKPWVLQVPLEGLADEDADAVVASVAFSAFNVNNPPITQLSVLRYGGARLSRMHENLLGLIARSVGRWSGKWQAALQNEVPELPEVIAAALKQGPDSAAEQRDAGANEDAAQPGNGDDEAEIPLPPELEEKLKLATETGDPETIEAVTEEVNRWREAKRAANEQAEREDRNSRGRRAGRRGREKGKDREPERKERPTYVSREQEAAAKSGGGPFHLGNALRQIENHVMQLRNELAATQTKLRKAENSPRRQQAQTASGGQNLSADELKRLVLQLEQRNADLQARVEDLLADSEARALATEADADVTVQYRTLLTLKLQEDYADYLALESGEPDVIVQQHYRALVRHIFSTLRAEGVALVGDLPPPPPEPMPPLPPPPEVDDEEEDDEELDRIEEVPEEAPDDEVENGDESDDADSDEEQPENDGESDENGGEEAGGEEAGDDEQPDSDESTDDEPRK